MKVRKGFSTDYARNKFDVEVDEADLARLLDEHKIPAELVPRVTTIMAFLLMNTLAEWLMLSEAAKISQSQAEKVDQVKLTYYATADMVRGGLGLPPIYTAQPAGAPG